MLDAPQPVPPASAPPRDATGPSDERDRAPLFTAPFVLLCFANFLAFLGVTMLFLLPVFLRGLGAHESDIGFVMGFGALGGAIGIPIAGVWSDRVGRRPFLVGGYLLATAASAGYLAVERLGALLYALRFLQGLGFAGCLVGGATMVTDLAPPRRLAQAIGLYGVATLITHAVGPTLAEWIALRHGFTAVFAASCAFQAAGLAATARVRETHAPGPPAAATPLWRIALRPALRRPLAAAALQATAFGAVVNFLPDYVTNRRLGRVAPYFIGYSLASLIVRLGFGDISDRLGRHRVALPTFFGYSLGMLALAWLSAGWQLWAIGALLGVTHGLSYPALNAMAVERADAAERGRVMSLYNLAFNVGMTAGAFAFGAIARARGYPTMYLMAAAIVVLGTFLVAADRRMVEGRR